MTKPPVEPLDESAPLARRMAADLCRKDPATGADCSWYHGLWQDLRLMGLAASPEHQAPFFLEAFRELGTQFPRPRVLVSGAADYSILAYALWACRANGLEPDLTVLDRCPTALHFNAWYAERNGATIHAMRDDILHHVPEKSFDVICSHSFIGQFRPELRPALVDKWWHLLAPGGAVVAVNRVRPAGGPVEISFSPDDARNFCAVVAERSKDLASPEEQAEILRRTEIYTRTSHTYTLSEEDFQELFARANFTTSHFSRIVSSDPKNRNIEGKAIPKNSTHACLVAHRPA